MLDTDFQFRLKKCLGFSIKQHSLAAFSGNLGLKKNKIYSTETITMKSPKKATIFL